MEYTYIAAFKIRGLIHVPDRGDVEIYADTRHKVRALLTENVHGYCYELYRARALGFILLKGFVGQREPDDLKKEIEIEINRIQEARDKDMNGSEVLVFTAEGDADADFSRPSRESDDFILGFDVIDKSVIIERHRTQVSAALTALFLSSNHDIIQVTQFGGDAYLTNEHQKPIFSLSFAGGGEAYSSIRTGDDVVDEAQKHSRVLAVEKSLSKVNMLIVQAISAENDGLRRFIFAWSALEILINKLFSEYERRFVENLLGAEPQKHTEKYFKRIRDVMKDKYRLMDKFIVLSACLSQDETEVDMKDFASIKEKRDDFFHGKSVNEEALPTAKTLGLLKKYLRLHITPKGA
jgi:hypothetical protein